MAARKIRIADGLIFGSKEQPGRQTASPANERRLKAAQGENKLMKLMKHITIALVLCAIPAMAFGQTVSCEDCTHAVSYYKGAGGLIATATEDTEMVTYVASCGGVTRTGELAAGDGGFVSTLFEGDLACAADEGTFELGPVMDGGWFWVTDDMNSAVGSLVDMDVLDNETTMLTGAGAGVTMTAGSGAVFVKETATGRVGILPNILPEPPMAAAAICGPRRHPAFPFPFSLQATSSCMLGGGGSKIRLTGRGTYGGNVHLTSGTVTRNNANGGDIVVRADLWVDESGSYSTADPATPAKGWIGTEAGNPNWLTDVGWTMRLAGAAPGANTEGAGVTILDADPATDGQAEITITPSPTYCPARGTQYTATVNIFAWADDAETAQGDAIGTTGGDADNLHPALATVRTLGGAHSAIQLTVTCPPRAAANQGQELVPENPFPTDK